MGYSHKAFAEEALKVKIRRAITMVQGDNPNPDIALKHPEWVRAAQNKNYTELTKEITQKVKAVQDEVIKRRNRFAGKD